MKVLKLKNRFFVLYDKEREDLLIHENVIIKIYDIEEMHNMAGYVINFKPISGDYSKYVKDVYFTDKGGFGKISYALAVRLLNEIESPNSIQKLLNKEE